MPQTKKELSTFPEHLNSVSFILSIYVSTLLVPRCPIFPRMFAETTVFWAQSEYDFDLKV
jgi:hypothetical protein